MQIKDFRVTPYPADFPVIREPGNFSGWVLTVELETGDSYNIIVERIDSPSEIASKLRLLAERIE